MLKMMILKRFLLFQGFMFSFSTASNYQISSKFRRCVETDVYFVVLSKLLNDGPPVIWQDELMQMHVLLDKKVFHCYLSLLEGSGKCLLQNVYVDCSLVRLFPV